MTSHIDPALAGPPRLIDVQHWGLLLKAMVNSELVAFNQLKLSSDFGLSYGFAFDNFKMIIQNFQFKECARQLHCLERVFHSSKFTISKFAANLKTRHNKASPQHLLAELSNKSQQGKQPCLLMLLVLAFAGLLLSALPQIVPQLLPLHVD